MDLYQNFENFKGIQVATRDDFNTLLKQGFSGDWRISIDVMLCDYIYVKFTRNTYTTFF
jgi:hypothetical protein